MAWASRDPVGSCIGEQALASGLRAGPRSTSAHLGWEDVRICNWATRVEAYQLPAVPELIVALHTGGERVERTGACRTSRTRSLPGQGTIRPPGHADAYRPSGPFRCTTAHIGVARIERVARHIADPLPLTEVPYRFGIDDPTLAGLLTLLAREIESPAEHGSLLAEHLIDALILHVLRGARAARHPAPAGALSPAILARVQARVEDGLAFPLAVADLAGEADLSPFHFSRAFKLSTGRSPHRYLTERRIERAKSLLQRGDQPICRIAVDSGFTSQQHFTDVFRRYTGTPPAAFRRLHRRTDGPGPSIT